MNTLIVYTTKYGATAECAAKLKKLLHGGVVLADSREAKPLTSPSSTASL